MMRRTSLLFTGSVASCLVLLAQTGTAGAQDDKLFFQGKTITIGVGAAAGGGLDTYARLISRHMGEHIPGHPSIVIANMPGAGGQVVARRLVVNAPKDGTFIATFFPSVLLDPLLTSGERPIDPSKFGYVGNAKVEASACMFRRDLGLKDVSDLRKREVTLGGTSGGSQVVDFPTVEKNLLGVKFKLITGYQGTREAGAAVERGEVQGICGIGWSTLKVQYPQLLTGGGFGTMFVQEDMKGDAELNAAGVPLMPSLAKTDIERSVLKVLYAQNDLARPYVVPPGTPKERLEILQKAFIAALSSKALQEEATKMHIDVNAVSGPDMQALIERLYATPKDVLENLKQALGRAQ